MIKCVDCDECEFRSEVCLCELSDNDETCPLGLFYDFQSCVVGVDTERRPVLSYEKMVLLVADIEKFSIETARDYVDFNVVRLLDCSEQSVVIMHERKN